MFKFVPMGALALGLALSGASAADLVPIKDPAPEFLAPSPFAGFYAGAFVGHGSANFNGIIDTSHLGPDPSYAFLEPFYGNPREHMIYGGYAGYNAINEGWLFGLEADIGGGNIAGLATGLDPVQLNLFVENAEHEIDYYGSLRGRVGATRGNTLLYATGGLAFAGSTLVATDVFDLGLSETGSKQLHNFGYVIGTGFERAFMNNWSLRAEALYFGPMNKHTLKQGELHDDQDAGDYVQIDGMLQLRMGLTYQFGGNGGNPAPASTSPYDGFYAGAFGGWGSASFAGVLDQGHTNPEDREYFNGHESGSTYGAYAGYNIVNNGWLFGLEADISAAHMDAETRDRGCCDQEEDLDIAEHEIDWIGSLRARLGVQTGNALIYGTGGIAYATSTVSRTNDVFDEDDDFETGEENLHSFGYVLGAGMEYMFLDNWTARLEGLYFGPMNKHQFRDEQINQDVDGSDYVRIDGMYQIRAGIAYHF